MARFSRCSGDLDDMDYSPLATRTSRVEKSRSPRRFHTRSTPPFRWSKLHRQTLMVCHQLGILSEEIARIFNILFQMDCEACGLKDGLRKHAIDAQYSPSNREKSKPWQEIESTSTDSELEPIRIRIQSLLESEGVSSAPVRPPARRHPATPARQPTRRRSSEATQAFPKPANVPTSQPSACRTRANVVTKVVTKTSLSPPAAITQRPGNRGIYERFPEDVSISVNRTRTISGQQVSLVRPTDPYYVIKDPVTAHEAHSPVPDLLFRFYDEHSQILRTDDGFLASSYRSHTIGLPPPPVCSDNWLFHAILSHLNKVKRTSDLISTTGNLFFAMRMAAKLNTKPRISVIRGSALPTTGVFHARPYHQRFHREKAYFSTTMRNNPAGHEYMVWARIPRDAILHDFSFEKLERHLAGNPEMRMALRMDALRSNKGGNTLRDKDSRQDPVALTPELTIGLAKFLPCLGVDGTTNGSIIARVVSEFIRGWCIQIQKSSGIQWDLLAGSFAYALGSHSGQRNLSGEQYHRVKEAFKSGLLVAQGKMDWHLNAKKRSSMLNKGHRLGLSDKHITVVEKWAPNAIQAGSSQAQPKSGRWVLHAVEITSSSRTRNGNTNHHEPRGLDVARKTHQMIDTPDRVYEDYVLSEDDDGTVEAEPDQMQTMPLRQFLHPVGVPSKAPAFNKNAGYHKSSSSDVAGGDYQMVDLSDDDNDVYALSGEDDESDSDDFEDQ